DKTIAKLYSAGKIKTPGDFYKLKISDISNLDNLGEKSAKKIISQIQGKKTLTLKQIFDAAAIPNLSHARIQQLIKAGFDTPEKLLNITQNELLKLPGFQKTLAKKIIDGLNFRRNWILSILSEITPKDQSTSALKLSNLSFAITGNLSLPRSQFIELIETQGGKFVSTVSKNTDYLLTNETDSTSSKFKLAKKFNVKIINEEQLKELISSR
ncbi:MAG TPA: helix-hairpin-helix domain-containing protein, partial [Candidatus Woesebacteria bacterium]|nr:helix-hairpin-helix domain-containing protein [Candidatus Woesebacteria bacterium]